MCKYISKAPLLNGKSRLSWHASDDLAFEHMSESLPLFFGKRTLCLPEHVALAVDKQHIDPRLIMQSQSLAKRWLAQVEGNRHLPGFPVRKHHAHARNHPPTEEWIAPINRGKFIIGKRWILLYQLLYQGKPTIDISLLFSLEGDEQQVVGPSRSVGNVNTRPPADSLLELLGIP